MALTAFRPVLQLPRALRLAPALLLVLAVFAAYAGARDNAFHFDDYDNIVHHAPVRMTTFGLDALWSAATDGFLPTRPLANLSFALDWWRGGGSPAAFIDTNVGLHALATVLVWLLLGQALGAARPRDRVLALGAALVWALHPIQVQAVSYVVQRMAELSALFSVLSVYAYVQARSARRRRGAWAVLALAGFGLGVASKENAWIVPALWWLAEFGVCRRDGALLRGGRDRVLFALPFLLVAAVVLDFLLGGPLSARLVPGYEHRAFTLGERLLTQPRVQAFHLSQYLWPLPGRFSVEHDFVLSTGLLTPWTTLPALLAVLAWLAAGLWALWHPAQRVLGFWLLWVPATLVIESSVVALEMVFEHRWYLPSVGLVGLAASLLGRCDPRWHRPLWVAGGALVLALAWATQARLPLWRDGLSLYGQAVITAPASGRAWTGLGEAQLLAGDVDAAEQSLRRAMQLDPEQAGAVEKLGVILLDRGDLAAAGALLQRAVLLRPDAHSGLNHLGEWFWRRGDASGALAFFDRAVARAPWEPTYRWNRALALERLGRCAAAKADWQAFLGMGPEPADRDAVTAHLAEVHAPAGACAG